MRLKITRAYYTYLANRVATLLRGTLTAAVFEKSLRLSHNELQNSAVEDLVSSDIDQMNDLVTIFHEIWSSFFSLALGMYVLATMVGYSCALMLVTVIRKCLCNHPSIATFWFQCSYLN